MSAKTAPVETPAAPAAAEPVTPDIFVHAFSETTRLAIDPESVRVPMPRGSKCFFHLAVAPDRQWRVGYLVNADKATLDVGCALDNPPHAERRDALRAGLLAVAKFLTKSKKTKALKALEDFHEAALPPESRQAGKLAPDPKAKPAEAALAGGVYRRIKVLSTTPNPWNRKTVSPEDFAALMESIRTEGLLEPIVVREIPPDELPEIAIAAPGEPRFQIIAGEQRWKAHVELGIEWIDARVLSDVSQAHAKVLTLIENLCRVQLNPVDEAEGYASLVAEGWEQKQIAERVKRSRPRVTNALRLLQLPPKVLDLHREGKLSPAHGEVLLKFVPEGKTEEIKLTKIPRWREVVEFMANEAVMQRVSAGTMAHGVPFAAELQQAGLAAIIDYFGAWPITEKLKKHPAYFQSGPDWVCLDVPHWEADCERRAEEKARADERERQRAAAEAEKAGKRKQLDLASVPRDSYVRFDRGADVLESLVPSEKLASAKSPEGRVKVVTDVELGNRLAGAWSRAVRKDRLSRCEDLAARVRKQLAKLKRPGVREIAWLVASLASPDFRTVPVYLDDEAAKRAGVKFPKLPEGGDVLAWLAKCDAAALVRALVENRLELALKELVDDGPESTGARLLRWWLDSDTLWLLEESEEGKANLLEAIKNSAWYQRALAGDATATDEKE